MEDISRLIVEHKEYLHPELTLGSLSVRTGINTTYLSRAVNRTTGLGFSRWVNELRVAEAVSRLSDPERTCNFSQIAYEVGFNDRTTFWRAFKQITGSSPREFCKKKCCDS